jgi:hypothetical protein
VNEGTREDLRLFAGLLAPVASFFFAQEGCLLLSRWVCRSGNRWPLVVVLATALAGTLAAGAASWQRLKGEDGDAIEGRRRFLAAGGLFLAVLMTLVLLAFAVPALLHRPCDG